MTSSRAYRFWLCFATILPLSGPTQAQAERATIDGLKGLRFGMSYAEVKKALPVMADEREIEADVIEPADLEADPNDTGERPEDQKLEVEVPGKRIGFGTSLGPHLAWCNLYFAVDDRLSRMTCELDPFSTAKDHTNAAQRILAVLTNRYGNTAGTGENDCKEEAKSDESPYDNFSCEREWVWNDSSGRLEVTSHLSGFLNRITESRIRLVVESNKHLQLVRTLQEQANQKLARWRKARREQRDNIKKHMQSLEQDLR